MDKARLKRLREQFRTGVFQRDRSRCIFCATPAVDAHHITDRSEMPNDGYAVENGASLCARCHVLVEAFHMSGGMFWISGMHPNDLYRRIGSSFDAALAACRNLDVTR
jgi:hypothetical protein